MAARRSRKPAQPAAEEATTDVAQVTNVQAADPSKSQYRLVRGKHYVNTWDTVKGAVRGTRFDPGDVVDLEPHKVERMDPDGIKFVCLGVETRPRVLARSQPADAQAEG